MHFPLWTLEDFSFFGWGWGFVFVCFFYLRWKCVNFRWAAQALQLNTLACLEGHIALKKKKKLFPFIDVMKWYFFLIVQFLKIVVEVKTKASGKIYCWIISVTPCAYCTPGVLLNTSLWQHWNEVKALFSSLFPSFKHTLLFSMACECHNHSAFAARPCCSYSIFLLGLFLLNQVSQLKKKKKKRSN